MNFNDALVLLEQGCKFKIDNKHFPLTSYVELTPQSNVSETLNFYVVNETTLLPELYKLSYIDLKSEWNIYTTT
jgi:hypothetical protein